MTVKCVALLGRRDSPTDALEEYCQYLGAALTSHGFEMQIVRVPWNENGWSKAIADMKNEARDWRGSWVLLQYTALSWSSRGFPSRVPQIIEILRQGGARVAVVYHDVEPFSGQRIIDRLRRRSQLHAMRSAQQKAFAIFTVPTGVISWRPDNRHPHAFIPVGANFPPPPILIDREPASPGRQPQIAVFGVTGGDGGRREIRDIARAVRVAAQELSPMRLVVLGRNSEAAENNLREALRGAPVDLQILGLLPPEEVSKALSRADVLLFVRGQISTRRGSAIAGIACGLPIVAFAGGETAPPITEAGLALYSADEPGDLPRVLVKVLSDSNYRESLAERSRQAQRQYFSWKAIATRYAEILRGGSASHDTLPE
jgi:glycosyltransferase involved in cell wall biosynthesis